MKFSDRLRLKRQSANMTQEQLAKATNITTRTIQNYETGARRPRNDEIIEKLAFALGCTYNELMGIADTYIIDAHSKGGSRAANEMEKLISEVVGLFAGGTMDEDSMDGVYRALSEAYWEAKDRNKKYTPKKNK